MQSKYFFDQFKQEIADEHKEFKSHQESKEVSTTKCDHKGKVKAVPGGLRCQCGAGWTGPNLDLLLKALT